MAFYNATIRTISQELSDYWPKYAFNLKTEQGTILEATTPLPTSADYVIVDPKFDGWGTVHNILIAKDHELGLTLYVDFGVAGEVKADVFWKSSTGNLEIYGNNSDFKSNVAFEPEKRFHIEPFINLVGLADDHPYVIAGGDRDIYYYFTNGVGEQPVELANEIFIPTTGAFFSKQTGEITGWLLSDGGKVAIGSLGDGYWVNRNGLAVHRVTADIENDPEGDPQSFLYLFDLNTKQKLAKVSLGDDVSVPLFISDGFPSLKLDTATYPHFQMQFFDDDTLLMYRVHNDRATELPWKPPKLIKIVDNALVVEEFIDPELRLTFLLSEVEERHSGHSRLAHTSDDVLCLVSYVCGAVIRINKDKSWDMISLSDYHLTPQQSETVYDEVKLQSTGLKIVPGVYAPILSNTHFHLVLADLPTVGDAPDKIYTTLEPKPVVFGGFDTAFTELTSAKYILHFNYTIDYQLPNYPVSSFSSLLIDSNNKLVSLTNDGRVELASMNANLPYHSGVLACTSSGVYTWVTGWVGETYYSYTYGIPISQTVLYSNMGPNVQQQLDRTDWKQLAVSSLLPPPYYYVSYPYAQYKQRRIIWGLDMAGNLVILDNTSDSVLSLEDANIPAEFATADYIYQNDYLVKGDKVLAPNYSTRGYDVVTLPAGHSLVEIYPSPYTSSELNWNYHQTLEADLQRIENVPLVIRDNITGGLKWFSKGEKTFVALNIFTANNKVKLLDEGLVFETATGLGVAPFCRVGGNPHLAGSPIYMVKDFETEDLYLVTGDNRDAILFVTKFRGTGDTFTVRMVDPVANPYPAPDVYERGLADWTGVYWHNNKPYFTMLTGGGGDSGNYTLDCKTATIIKQAYNADYASFSNGYSGFCGGFEDIDGTIFSCGDELSVYNPAWEKHFNVMYRENSEDPEWEMYFTPNSSHRVIAQDMGMIPTKVGMLIFYYDMEWNTHLGKISVVTEFEPDPVDTGEIIIT